MRAGLPMPMVNLHPQDAGSRACERGGVLIRNLSWDTALRTIALELSSNYHFLTIVFITKYFILFAMRTIETSVTNFSASRLPWYLRH
jgi:hypothetical protein